MSKEREEKSNHTPLPWIVEDLNDIDRGYSICKDDDNGTTIAALIDNKNDAELMVKAPVMLDKIGKLIKESEGVLVYDSILNIMSKRDIIESYLESLKDIIK
jgi:hypothetical protein